ncbi:hypothetical protein FSP39_014627 [Pinctada imbricata]|uniref:Uncharacterized protein n=1 Tax=Pinctada imbricata TaxID=66713 RepID=A0AA88XMI3_PINIB|nr:hypothetical protein FSP39_014627 [Pinctada imbricata]
MFVLCSVLAFLGLLVKNSSSLTGANICQTDNGPACCYNTYEVDGRCVECPPGYYGLNCKTRCKAGFYGQSCRSWCNCENQYCDAVSGCKTTTTSTTTTTTTPKPTTTKTTKPSTTLPKTTPRASISISTPGIIPEGITDDSAELYFSTESSRTTADAVRNGSLRGAQRGVDSNAIQQDQSLSPSQDINLSTIIAIVSSALAVLLIIAIAILLINNKVKKAKKRQDRGRRNERAAISVMSKIYDEINDSLVRPSCSNDVQGAEASADAGNAKYETIAKMRGKSNDAKGSRGSYELLDEATKNVNVKQLNRGSYEPLESVAKITTDYECLDSSIEEKDEKGRKGIKKGRKSKGSKKIDLDSDNKPVYAHVSKNTMERKASETKLTAPDDYLEPPLLPPARFYTSLTKKATDGEDSTVHYNEVCEDDNKPLLILEVDASSKRQLANSIVNESYEIPPLPKQTVQSEGSDTATSENLVLKEQNDLKLSYTVQEPVTESKEETSCVNESESNIENYDIPPPKLMKETKGWSQEETSDKNNDVVSPDLKSTHSADEGDAKSLTDYDVPPPRITADQEDPADYDVPPNKIPLTPLSSLGNGTISKGGEGLSDQVSDYDTPVGVCKNDNYDVPPVKRV